jgi:hypothetical protein
MPFELAKTKPNYAKCFFKTKDFLCKKYGETLMVGFAARAYKEMGYSGVPAATAVTRINGGHHFCL